MKQALPPGKGMSELIPRMPAPHTQEPDKPEHRYESGKAQDTAPERDKAPDKVVLPIRKVQSAHATDAARIKTAIISVHFAYFIFNLP